MKYINSVFILIFFTVFISSNCNSQYALDSKEAKEFKQLKDKLEGHYQIQVINSRQEPQISYEMLKAINENFESKKEGSFYYKNNIKITLSPNKKKEYLEKKVIHSSN